MKVSDGTFWVPVCRVFAGSFTPGIQSLAPMPFGSQVGITDEAEIFR
jgi:hypothetical protein